MFGIGSTELLVILVVALIVLGPKSLAGVSRSLGKAMGEFRRVSTDFQRTLNYEAAQDDLREEQKRKKNPASNPESSGESVSMKTAEKMVDLPEDSPVAQALSRAKAEAVKNTAEGGSKNA